MKKAYILFLFQAGFVVSVLSQSLSLSSNNIDKSNDTIYLNGNPEDAVLEAHIVIHNVTDKAVDVHLKRTEITVIPNSTNSFCWGEYCYPPYISESNVPINIPARGANTGAFTGEYYPAQDMENQSKTGTSVIRYTFSNAGNPADSVSITVFYQIGAAGISDWTKDPGLFKAYPNPTSGALTIDFPGSVTQNVSLRVLAITGQTIMTQDLLYGQSKTTINLDAFPRGYYFLEIRDQNGTTALKKILKSQ